MSTRNEETPKCQAAAYVFQNLLHKKHAFDHPQKVARPGPPASISYAETACYGDPSFGRRRVAAAAQARGSAGNVAALIGCARASVYIPLVSTAPMGIARFAPRLDFAAPID